MSAIDASTRRARAAVAAVFFLNGFGVASWLVRIPAVQTRLALSAGTLGVVLLGASVGALIAMPGAGRLVVRRGSSCRMQSRTARAATGRRPVSSHTTRSIWSPVIISTDGTVRR